MELSHPSGVKIRDKDGFYWVGFTALVDGGIRVVRYRGPPMCNNTGNRASASPCPWKQLSSYLCSSMDDRWHGRTGIFFNSHSPR